MGECKNESIIENILILENRNIIIKLGNEKTCVINLKIGGKKYD